METMYLSAAETAKLIRAALKKAFPGVKFSVRSENFSMGSSIRVSWTGGPSREDVDAVTHPYQCQRFDGSIDYGWTVRLWLLPDGSAVVANDPGSQTTGGYMPETKIEKPHADAKLISNSCYVSTCRYREEVAA
jgi:hypothetical protein